MTNGAKPSDWLAVQCAACPVRRNAVYRSATLDDLEVLAELHTGCREVRARSLIVREGEQTEVFTLQSGWAYRFRTLHDGRRQILSFLMPGDLIGLQALRGHPANYAARALTDATLCAFDTEALQGFLRSRRYLIESLVDGCAREVETLEQRLVDLGRRTAMERVACLVLEIERGLRERGLSDKADCGPFPLRQEHIADALGLTPVHVSRTLGKLRELGLLEIGGGELCIHDAERLAALAEGRALGSAPTP
jgi:CRP-like cAMP-binding protein